MTKSIRKWAFGTLAVSCLGLALFFLPCQEGAAPAQEEPVSANPGYFEQWFEMKKNTEGIIPKGMYTEWYNYDMKMAAQRPAMKTGPLDKVEFIGPRTTGGRTRALIFDAANPNRILAGAVSGGVWESTDLGQSWSAINDQSVNMSVTCMVQNPLNSNIIYYGTGEPRANSSGVPGEGVFKSTDGGQTFTQLPSTIANLNFDYIWSIAHSKVDANTVYVGTSGAGLWRSTDGGTNWTQVWSGASVYDIETFPDGSILFGRSIARIYRSTTGNPGSWTQITSSAFPTSGSRIEIDACEAQPNIVYALFEDGAYSSGANGFARSTDGGLTWTARPIPSIGATYGTYCFMLGVSSTNPDHLVAAGVSPRYSTNGGQTWTYLSSGHADYHAYYPHPTHPDSFLIGNDGGVWMYQWSNPNGTRQDLNEGYYTTQFYAGDHAPIGRAAIGGTQDNGTFRIKEPGGRKLLGGDGAFCHISNQNPDRAYASYQNGSMRRSANYTSTYPSWQSFGTSAMSSEGYSFINPFFMAPGDGELIFVRTGSGLWRSSDAGVNFTKINTTSIGGLYAAGFTEDADPIMYFGGSSARFYRMDNAKTGAVNSFVDLSASVPSTITNDYIGAIHVHPSDSSVVYVGFTPFNTTPRIWKVTGADGSSPTWTAINGDLPSKVPVNAIAADPNDPDNVLFAATDFGLYYTTNGGTNWIKETDIPNVSIHQMSIRKSDRTLYLYTHGRGVWYAELDGGGSPCNNPVTSFDYEYGFEAGFGDWIQDQNDDFNWKLRTGSTPTKNTGPSAAFEGSYYVYTEVNKSTRNFKTANLISPCYDFSDLLAPKMIFAYHMYGKHMGVLNIDYSKDGGQSWINLWTKSGNQGNQWYQDTLVLDSLAYEPFVQFRFSGTTRDRNKGDMAFDAVVVGLGLDCHDTYPYNVSFETGLEDWTQVGSDNWTRYSGSTPTSNTGPSAASDGSHYLYIESSAGDFLYCDIQSPCLDFGSLSNPYLIFDYHLWVDNMDEFGVAVSTNGINWTYPFSERGNKGNQWNRAYVDLSAWAGDPYVLVKIYGITDEGELQDMAIDNIVIKDSIVAGGGSAPAAFDIPAPEARAWPNPFSSHLNFQIPLPEGTPIEVMMANTLGQVVYRASMAATANPLSIPVERLETGIYFLRVIGEGQKFDFKLIRD